MDQCNTIAAELGIEAMEYQKTSNNRYLMNGALYSNFADMQSGKVFVLKRIYTVEEASRLSKETGNTFKLRYK